VIGQIPENWSDRLGGMMITSTFVEGQQVITSLQGKLVDQAALIGVLKALYDLHFPLFSAVCLGVTNQE